MTNRTWLRWFGGLVLGGAFLVPCGKAVLLMDGVPPIGMPKNVHHVTALCADLHGGVWVGTEGAGVWRWNAQQGVGAAAWKQFTRQSTGGHPEKDGPVLTTGTTDVNALGDDCAYALACDRLGRIWVGHLNHGVSVFNGATWRNYDVVSGPLGERVFAIKTCPVDGDVWIANSAGLARYSLAEDSWSYITRAEGLPSDQIQALAFGEDGTLYAGTQCDGLAICVPHKTGMRLDYQNWRRVAGADELPVAATGDGLPSSLINDVLVARDGTIYVGTTTGLAWSRDLGVTWHFLRGADWLAKAKGLYQPPTKEKIERGAKQAPATLLAEDYCTCLAEDEGGSLWIGHWRKGYEAWQLKSGAWQKIAQAKERLYTWCLLAQAGGVASNMLAGNFGEGLQIIQGGESAAAATLAGERRAATSRAACPPLPSMAKPPTTNELLFMTRIFLPALQASNMPQVVFLREDWMTWGDWVGRYGRAYAKLCAMNTSLGSHGDQSQTLGSDQLTSGKGCKIISTSLGPHHSTNDILRSWIYWLTTSNRRVLYTPLEAIRCEAEWDDHGEAYAYTYDGPNIHIGVQIPEGLYRASIYFFNPNGQGGNNRLRDYVVELIENQPPYPVLSRTRVRNFAGGGVYKQFFIKRPGEYVIRILRNNSFNTIINGVFIDRLAGSVAADVAFKDGDVVHIPKDYYEAFGMRLDNINYAPPSLIATNKSPKLNLAMRDMVAWLNDCPQPSVRASILLPLSFRFALTTSAPADIRQYLAWKICCWDTAQRQEFSQTMAKGFWRMQKRNPGLRTKAERPYSPNTYATPDEWDGHNKTEP